MDWLELLNQIFQICIIPLLGVLTTFLVAYINKKKEALKTQVDNTLYHKYIEKNEKFTNLGGKKRV